MKNYLKIEEHGYNGDFYRCNAAGGGFPFRADNLTIATKIAYNNWLHGFDSLYRSCRLVSIRDGEFAVVISRHSRDGATESTETITHTVDYYGPADMYTIEYAHRHGSNEYQRMYSEMERMVEAGDPRVRRSKRSGIVMFNVSFPQYRKNGDWWDHEHSYLSTDPELALEQWDYINNLEIENV